MRPLLLSLVAALALACQRPLFDVGVGAFDVSPDGAILWTHVFPPEGGADVAVTLELSGAADFGALLQSIPASATAARGHTVHVPVGGLEPATQHHYRFRIDRDGAPPLYSSAGSFRTAPDPDSEAPVRFVLSGDANMRFVADRGIGFYVLEDARAQDPDFFVYFGDTVYADTGFLPMRRAAVTLDEYRTVHRFTRLEPSVQRLIGATGTFTGWDDHEVKNDYAGETVEPARFAAGAQAFLEWLPVRQAVGDSPSRIHRRVRWGKDLELFFLDGRQFRTAERFCNPTLPDGPQTAETLFSPFVEDEALAAQLVPPSLLGSVLPILTPSDPDCVANVLADPKRKLLGDEQLAWLKQGLLDSTATFKVVINDVPISTLLFYPYDRWDAYIAERSDLLAFLAANFGPDEVLFLTTDFHMNLGLRRSELTELVVGPIATPTFGQTLISLLPPELEGNEGILFLLVDALVARANAGTYLGSAYDALSYALLETSRGEDGVPRLRVSVRGDPDYASGDNDPGAVQELFSFELPR